MAPADKVGGDFPAIHVFVESRKGKRWMPGIKRGMTSKGVIVDALRLELRPARVAISMLCLGLYGVDYGLPHNGTPRTIAKLSHSRNQPKVICSISELRKPRLVRHNHADALDPFYAG